jgi:hypothetical protein
MRCGHERRRGDHAGEGGEGQHHLIDRVEERLLVLLEVAVVGEREPLQRDEQRRQVADEAARLAARQLGDVGVLLLGQHRRPGGVPVVETGEPELLAGPQHPLLAEARQVHAQKGEVEQRLGDEVTIADGVERVVEGSGEAEVGRGAGRVDRQRGAGERTGAEWRHVETFDRGEQPVDVACERPAVRQEVMGQEHGLCPLEMGVAGQVGVAGLERSCEQHLLKIDAARATSTSSRLHHSRDRWPPDRCGSARCAAWRRPRRPVR